MKDGRDRPLTVGAVPSHHHSCYCHCPYALSRALDAVSAQLPVDTVGPCRAYEGAPPQHTRTSSRSIQLEAITPYSMAFSLSSDGDFVLPPPLTKSTTVFPPRSPPRAHDLPTLGSRATAASSAKLSTAPLPLRAKAAPGAAVEIIDIDDSDDDDTREEEAPNDRVTSLPPGHHAHASQAAPRGVMHKTISAPVLPSSRKNAVTGRGGQPARRPLNDSDDSDASLPDLGDIGLGTSATMLWSQPWDASGTVPARLKPDKGKGRQISSSAAPALGAGRVTAASRGGDSSATTDSDDEPVKKKGRVNKTAPAIASGSGSAGTGSRAASALTKEQEREAKKRAKDQEKLEKAVRCLKRVRCVQRRNMADWSASSMCRHKPPSKRKERRSSVPATSSLVAPRHASR